MAYIWLKYSTGGTPSAYRFNVLDYDDLRNTEHVRGRTLRQIEYAHRLSKRTTYTLTISADELLLDTPWNFLKDFWVADRWYLCIDDSVTEPAPASFVEITIPSGDMPVEYINNHKRFRRVVFQAVAKNPE